MTVFRVVHGDLQEVNRIGKRKEQVLIFFNGDCYLVDSKLTIWIWIGHRSSVDERFSASFQASQLRLKRGEIPSIVSVFEDKEPLEFLSFVEPFFVVDGGVHGFLKTWPGTIPSNIDPTIHLPALYKIENAKIINLPLSRKVLESSDVFFLDTGLILWIWIGKTASINKKTSLLPINAILEKNLHRPEPELRWVFENEEDPRFFEYFRLWE